MLLASVLAGCGQSATTASGEAGGDEAPLPAPQGTGGVTGMPDSPGPNPPPPEPAELPLEAPATADGLADPAPEPGTVPAVADGSGPASTEPAPAEPTPQDAAAVVRDYYAAIAAGRFEQAYALWADEGRASGRSPQQFAAGFADTASVSAEVLEPGRVEGAAGSRYIEVPVAVTAVHHDGSRHEYVGAYTLRRAVVDGASDGQRAWRLSAADIREVRL